MTLSSLTGPLLRSGGVTRARTPVELTTREAGLPSAPPAKLPSVPWLSTPNGISAAAGAAAKLVSGNAVEASLIAGVALAQLGGTDNLPTVCALPMAADAARAPKPGAKCPGEDSPPFSAPSGTPWLHGWKMEKFFHCEIPRLVELLATLVQVAWLPTPEIMEYRFVHVVDR